MPIKVIDMYLRVMPKVELHVHLDGSVNLDLISNLSGDNFENIKEKMVAPDKCVDLKDYLGRFDYPCYFMQSKDNLELVAKNLLNDLKKENVIYAEVRFAPLKHMNNGLSIDDVIDSVINGFKDNDLKVNLILCMMRNDSFEDNMKVIETAKNYLNKGVCAVDLAGDEAHYPTGDFKDLFKASKDYEIPFTIHAGEADGASSVHSAIAFGAKRIGHGIRCLEDKDLVNQIIDKNIHLEVCPTSNIQTNVINSISEHPIRKLFDLGVNLSINTDNRTVSNTSLTNEYTLLRDNLNFGINDFIKCNINAINSSFLSDEDKVKLKERYMTYFN